MSVYPSTLSLIQQTLQDRLEDINSMAEQFGRTHEGYAEEYHAQEVDYISSLCHKDRKGLYGLRVVELEYAESLILFELEKYDDNPKADYDWMLSLHAALGYLDASAEGRKAQNA